MNPTNSEINIALNLVLSSLEYGTIMTLSMNGEKLDVINIPDIATNIQIENLVLKPGLNVVILDADKSIPVSGQGLGYILEESQMSFKVESISIVN